MAPTFSAPPVSSSRNRARERADRAERTHLLLTEIDDATDAEKDQLIAQLIDVNMPVAESIAARYRRRGIPDEDLEQVAYLALVRVAHNYDHARGHDFLSYAVPSIRGEVRRYFRDQGWMVRPPRGIQEMQGRIAAVESELSTRLGHPPSADELAEEFDEPVSDVEEAMAANGCFTPTSLDQVPSSDTSTIADQLGEPDTGIDAAEARVVLTPVVRRLTERERKILDMRFFAQCTQQEIADEIGVTQMQVSRLLSSLLRRLRTELESGAATPAEDSR
ncbi:MAG TPA: sigma-70 family RNA polymerase sigma factor [Nocardioides sp.]|uniref:sigma-70 family RNA polymerase sigma factor n=1 Tax=Nocardioides sp. TaxID=35761 RepID=UPI002F3ED1B4